MRYTSLCSESDFASEDEGCLTLEDLERIDAGFDESALTRRIYSASSETLFARLDKMWTEYAPPLHWRFHA